MLTVNLEYVETTDHARTKGGVGESCRDGREEVDTMLTTEEEAENSRNNSRETGPEAAVDLLSKKCQND